MSRGCRPFVTRIAFGAATSGIRIVMNAGTELARRRVPEG